MSEESGYEYCAVFNVKREELGEEETRTAGLGRVQARLELHSCQGIYGARSTDPALLPLSVR